MAVVIRNVFNTAHIVHSHRGRSLVGADLSRKELLHGNFAGRDLRDADLSGSRIRIASFRGANLRGVDWVGADLTGSDMRGAKIGVSHTLFMADTTSVAGLVIMRGRSRQYDWGAYRCGRTRVFMFGCRAHHMTYWTPERVDALCYEYAASRIIQTALNHALLSAEHYLTAAVGVQ